MDIPADYYKGEASANGDCFYHSVQQCLKQIHPHEDITIKSLRLLCKKFMDLNPGLDFLNNNNSKNIELTGEEIETPIWGRTEIEGRIICKIYDIKLHVRELHSINGNDVWIDDVIDRDGSVNIVGNFQDDNIIHIINSGNHHFEPLLKIKHANIAPNNAQCSLNAQDFIDEEMQEISKRFINAARTNNMRDLQNILQPYIEDKGYFYYGILITPDDDDMKAMDHAAISGHWDVVKFLFECFSGLELKNEHNQPFLDYLLKSLPDKDAIYKLICLGNPELLQFYISNHRTDPNLLAEICEELKVKNVEINHNMKTYIHDTILNGRFYSERNSGHQGKITLDMMNSRKMTTIRLMNDIIVNYNTNKNIDQIFLQKMRYVVQNIRVLKYHLRSTYEYLPWEQIEFSICIFLTYFLKPKTTDINYILVLDAQTLVNYLKQFKTELNNTQLTEKDVGSNLPTQKKVKLAECFTELDEDFYLIRTIYSLNMIKDCVDVAVAVDAEEKGGKIVIERTLQIVGECLKNTLQSPKMSSDVQNALIYCSPQKLKECLTAMRDSLSHVHTLSAKIEIERRNCDIFKMLQNDITKIASVLVNILYAKRIDAYRKFARKILNCDNLDDVKAMIKIFYAFDVEVYDFENYNCRELKRIKELVAQFAEELGEYRQLETSKLEFINELIQSEEDRLQQMNMKYWNCSNLFDLISSNNLRAIKTMCEFICNYGMQESSALTQIYFELYNVYKKYFHPAGKSNAMDIIIFEIFLQSTFHAKSTKSVVEFKTQLESGHDEIVITDEYVHEKILIYITAIKNYQDDSNDQVAFEQQFESRKSFYQLRVDLSEKIIKGDDYEEELKDFRQRISPKELKKLDASKNLSKTLENFRDDYKLLFNATRNFYNSKDAQKFSVSLNAFVKSLQIKTKKKPDSFIVALIRDEEKKFYSDNFYRKLHELQQLENDLDKGVSKYATDMLVLDLLEVFQVLSLFVDNTTILDPIFPTISGRHLRNYLAHGDILFDMLPVDMDEHIIHAADELRKGAEDIFHNKNDALLGHVHTESCHKKYYIKMAETQNQMLLASKRGCLEEIQICIKNGADINGRDCKGWNGLHYAASGNCVEAFRFFMDNNISVYSTDINNLSPLDVAAKCGHEDIFRAFPEIDNTILQTNSNKKTRFHHAVQSGNEKLVRLFIANDADVNARTECGATALHLAAHAGYLNVVELLVVSGAEINARNDTNNTPLELAYNGGHAENIKFLLHTGAEPKPQTPLQHIAAMFGHEDIIRMHIQDNTMHVTYSCTPLHIAAHYGQTNIVKILLQNEVYDVDCRDGNNSTPLHNAAAADQVEVMRTLLEFGADVNARDASMCTPLHKSARSSHLNATKVLIEFEANVEAKADNDCTPLYLAVHNNSLEVPQLLITNNAMINTNNYRGWTPLHLSAQFGYENMLSFLISRGGDIEMRNNLGVTPLHTSALYGHLNIAKILIHNKAKVNAKDNDKCTPLFYAAQNGFAEIAGFLLQQEEIDVNFANIDVCTPLYIASQNGQEAVVQLLVDKEAIIDTWAANECTPLYIATQLNHESVVKILLDYGADINAESTPLGRTALCVAAECGHENMVRLLLDRGAKIDATKVVDSTAMQLAAVNRHDAIQQMLLDWDLNRTYPDIDVVSLITNLNFDDEDAIDMVAQYLQSAKVFQE